MTDSRGRFCLASNDIAHEEFDGELVVLNLSSGLYFALNPTASFLLKCLLQGHSLDQLAAISGAPWSAADVHGFVGQLLSHELVAVDTRAPVPMDDEMLGQATKLSEQPLLESHNDLADLIIADPIHDADQEVGWPKPKAA